MDMKTFKEIAKKFSPKVAIRLRGRHGIGKSQGVYQVANELGLEVVERRLSQMTEGDVIGLPVLEGGKDGSTLFRPCDWLMDCVHNPRILFLDEINRALEPVKQAMFQLADSRKFYGYELHPETRLFVAENIGDQYQVQSNDPAEISRYAVIDLQPEFEEWMSWAKENLHDATVSFIRSNPGCLEPAENTVYENNKKYPDRRAWSRLDQELVSCGLMEAPEDPLFYSMCLSMVGVESSLAFTDFCKNRERDLSAKDVMENWKKARKRAIMKRKDSKEEYIPNEKLLELSAKIGDYCDKNDITDDQAKQISEFMKDCPPEIVLNTWGTINNNQSNLLKVFPHVRDTLLQVCKDQMNEAEGENKAETEETAKTESTKKTSKKSK